MEWIILIAVGGLLFLGLCGNGNSANDAVGGLALLCFIGLIVYALGSSITGDRIEIVGDLRMPDTSRVLDIQRGAPAAPLTAPSELIPLND